MKIALIAPPYPLEEAPAPPLGISYVAAICESAGAKVKILDYIVSKYSPEKLKKELDEFCPDAIGSTSVTLNFQIAAEIIKTAKKHCPSLTTMMGGPHVSFDIKNTLTKYPEIDLIVVGEAEDTLLELLPAVKEKDKWSNIKGIAFKNPKNNEIIITDKREFIQNLDKIPLPARHLLPMSRYQALGYPVSIITSRGCPHSCIFCLGRKMVGHKVRYRNVSLVADEIEHIISYGMTRINIADDLFTSNKERVTAFCDEIKKRNINFTWSAFARVNTVDAEILKMMKDTGCDSICFGTESGNQEILKLIRKGITIDQIKKAVAVCKEVGIRAFASFIAGLPGESHETLNDTKKLGESLGVDYGYHLLAPFPGTIVREEIEKYDLEILSDNWSDYDANKAIVKTSHLNPEDLDNFVNELVEFHKKKWDIILEKYKNNKCNGEEFLMMEGFHRMELIFKLLSQDLIEENAYFNNTSSPISMLSNKIAEITNANIEFVHRTIKSLNEAGYLKYENSMWFWTHNSQQPRPQGD